MSDGITVYLVDDDDDDRMFTREALESVLNGVCITEFTDGNQLLDVLEGSEQAGEPSLIILDINMPRVGGLEVLSIIRSKPALCHIPVMLFSTSSSPDLIKEAYQTGVNAYLVKPAELSGYMQMARAVSLCFTDGSTLAQKPSACRNRKSKNILVIEDNADQWHIIRLAMEPMGNNRLVHRDSAESTMAFLTSAYEGALAPLELIVLDLYLPGRQQGLDLIETVRAFFARQNLAPVPIIVFSASDHKDDIKASYQRRANAYITKSADLARSALYLSDVCSLWATTIAVPRVA